MHEILFRGKRLDNDEWVYGVPISYSNSLVVMCREFKRNENVVPDTVGQFTGLTDKNGKKIFEGDILLGKRKTPYAVRYSQNIAAFVADGMGVLTSPVMNTGTMKECEVVGNIYDNPELMEKAEKKEDKHD